MLEIVATFICLTTLLTYVNYRFIGLPPAIGVMVTALLFSLMLQGLSLLGYPGLEDRVRALIGEIDFNDLLMNWMLSFLLFAGALHVNLGDLKSYRWPIGLLATFGVLIATFVIGTLAFYIFAMFGWHISFLYCLLFGALISPTDPIAVLGALRTANASKPLKTTIVGESLFNDGTAVVVFTVLLGIAQLGEAPTVGATAMLFVHEAIGGVLFGGLIGYAVYRMIKSVEQYQVEVMLTLALVIGGSALAYELHVSAPIAMVVAGLIIGNLGRKLAMNDMTRRYMDGFWELLDDMLNAALFALIGMELLLLPFSWTHLTAASMLAVAILLSRFITVAPAIALARRWRNIPQGSIRVLTWGGLRGGVSVALALALPVGPERDLLLSITYIVVLSSILLQGLTIGKVVKAVTAPKAG
ncbi:MULTISPECIES: sodium:proton antiporter [unclassified Pseudomonas]|uniref:cation:proton antiporter n=1 Tax=unclassified Pseudomonas TaxID=196821 RepID=UPI000BCE1B59|nr:MULTISPECIES: sodium:proton antiporter [unclassified Pseudomonas]PVZ15563.1 CPA1 family monovalent cation:H+ antiporter [Pseudomonas sp. URIL14HWK12:I12]PVZ24937.1 CPA1 family monovalent cation:H+ antiporter [Pseudomonas sp. URIL14HWK12:I10]PVZ34783.1 CPA1 family monovalent cation:H+ antiporter [Pseudomonas sp. URIL14HWK12:I11]SNZ09285.1 sodium/proton antiporter, CPA1 family (TC 2.A.36) [Pseudomonas sp. URIL14HWK12:I9]